MSTTTERRTTADIVTTRILDQLDAGTVPWRRPWSGYDGDPFPRNLLSGNRYNGINVMLLASVAYELPWWLTYRQAQQLGGHVRKGEHHTPIVVRKETLRRLRTPQQIDVARKERRRIVEHPDGGLAAQIVFARIYRVFNVEQTVGLEGHPSLDPIPEPDWDPIVRCEEIAMGYPDPPAVEVGGTRAFYDLLADRVQMPDSGRFAEPSDWYATKFHELAHSTGHASRLDRDSLKGAVNDDADAYACEELTAEIGAAILCAHARIDAAPLDDQHAAYVDHWRRKITDDPQLVMTAARRAQQAVDHILGAGAAR